MSIDFYNNSEFYNNNEPPEKKQKNDIGGEQVETAVSSALVNQNLDIESGSCLGNCVFHNCTFHFLPNPHNTLSI